jgi:hypothetical protein
MRLHKRVTIVPMVVFFVTSVACFAACTRTNAGEGSTLQVSLVDATGGIENLKVDRKDIKLPAAGGGFSAYDAAAKQKINFAAGSVKRLTEKTIFSAQQSDNLRLTAQFVDKGAYVQVSGELENLKKEARGILLDYCIPPLGPDCVVWNELNKSVKLGENEQEGNLFPIAALCNANLGIALAIPPSEPRDFGMLAANSGLSIRFYLGLSPQTKKFPNRASFVFIVYPVETNWGFRSALGNYYRFYPDYYDCRLKRPGEILIPTRDGQLPPDIEHYAHTRVNFRRAEEEFARNKKNGILSHGYMNPGVVELTQLPEKPRNLEEATAVYKRLCESTAEEWTEGGGDPSPTELIRNSACMLSNRQPAMFVRYTPGGKNSIAFKSNPNPELFGDKKVSIGKKALWTAEEWLAKYPQLDAIMIDSLGANWPAQLNYREDHFAYAQYPLTCDSTGRPSLHNQFSYYELLSALRMRLRAKDKYLLGNGVYSYPSNQTLEPEHYRGRGTLLGRFFLAALLDMATSESGVRADQTRLEFCRVALARKPYVLTNSDWKDVEATRNWFNKTLVYGICGSNVRIYSSTEAVIPYYPEGYERDKELIGWYMSLQERLGRAGWEPVTYASACGEKILLERFGSGDKLYFVLMSESDHEQPCTLSVDLPALGIAADANPQQCTVEEIAQSMPLVRPAPGKIQLQLQPCHTAIVVVTKKS